MPPILALEFERGTRFLFGAGRSRLRLLQLSGVAVGLPLSLLLASVAPFYLLSAARAYDVEGYGAIGDGATYDHDAISNAMDACAEEGGTVVLREGTLLTGQIELRSDMRLHIDRPATALGMRSNSEGDCYFGFFDSMYPNRTYEGMQRRLTYGNRVENVKITVAGVIDGQGDFPPWMNTRSLGAE